MTLFFIGFLSGQSWNTHTSSDDDWEEDLNKTNCNNANSQVQNDDDDDGWNDTPTHGTWTSSSRGTGVLSLIPFVYSKINMHTG